MFEAQKNMSAEIAAIRTSGLAWKGPAIGSCGNSRAGIAEACYGLHFSSDLSTPNCT